MNKCRLLYFCRHTLASELHDASSPEFQFPENQRQCLRRLDGELLVPRLSGRAMLPPRCSVLVYYADIYTSQNSHQFKYHQFVLVGTHFRAIRMNVRLIIPDEQWNWFFVYRNKFTSLRNLNKIFNDFTVFSKLIYVIIKLHLFCSSWRSFLHQSRTLYRYYNHVSTFRCTT